MSARSKALLRFAGAFLCSAATACVSFPPAPAPRGEPRIEAGRLVTADGAELGLDSWPATEPRAILLAVHGMNDYARHFAGAAEWLSASGITVYAYDQRGFGRSPQFGRWVGEETLQSDLRSAIAAARAEHPGVPLYVLGHSMGAAVVLSAAAEETLDVDGAILAAPAVWGGSRMPLAYRISANIAAAFAPGKTLTGERAGRRSTDNIAALREMIADPLVIKPTRLDAILGVTRIMGSAWDATDETGGRALLLTGARDEIIPPEAQEKAAGRLCGRIERRVYPDGWHLLLRDLQAEAVYRDIAGWIDGGLPDLRSAAGRFGPAALQCDASGP